MYKCNICGYDSTKFYYCGKYNECGWRPENYIDNIKSCACCNGTVTKPGINDIYTTSSWMVDYFVDKNDCMKYTDQSGHKSIVRCKNCGELKQRIISEINRYHGVTCLCRDKISYPEKFMYAFLSYFKIPFIFHYRPKWDFSNENRKFYEYDFLIKNNKYCEETIIELQGMQHYKSGFKNLYNTKPLEDEINNDKMKMQLAYKYGYDKNTYNVIDCRFSTINWIIKNIKNAYCFKNLKYTQEDLNIIIKNTTTSLCKQMCIYYQKNLEKGIYLKKEELGKKFNICISTVSEYLEIGRRLNWCEYDGKNICKRLASEKRYNEVYVYDLSGNYIGCYRSATYLANNSQTILNIKLSRHKIFSVLRHKRYSYENYIFTYEKDKLHNKTEICA